MSFKMDALNKNLDFQRGCKKEANKHLAVFVWFNVLDCLGQQFDIPGAKLSHKNFGI